MARWKFYDPETGETAEFEINPVEGGSRKRKKNITTAVTSSPVGNVILMQGTEEAEATSIAGVVLTEDEFDFFEEWYDKTNIIQVQDDLGRAKEIYIHSLSLDRERAVHSPWKHSYTMEYYITEDNVSWDGA